MTEPSLGATRLKTWREEKGYSQSKLGDFLKLTGAYVSMLESGQRTPGVELMFNLRELAGIQPEDWRLPS